MQKICWERAHLCALKIQISRSSIISQCNNRVDSLRPHHGNQPREKDNDRQCRASAHPEQTGLDGKRAQAIVADPNLEFDPESHAVLVHAAKQEAALVTGLTISLPIGL